MRILVTGSGGFVGSSVYRQLKASGHHTVYGTVHSPENYEDQNMVFCELSDPLSVERLPRVDVLVHVAAKHPFKGGRFEDYFTANCTGTYNLVKWAEKTGVKKMIYIGAVSSYGRQSGVLSPKNPRVESDSGTKDYSLSKAVSDRIIEQSPIDSMTVVLPGVLGMDSHDCWLVRLAADILQNKPVRCYNPDNLFNNAVTAEGVAGFIGKLTDREVPGKKTVILGAKDYMTVREICNYLKDALKSASEITYETTPGTGFTIDTEAALREGFEPLSMREMLDVTAKAVAEKRFKRTINKMEEEL